MTLSINFEQFWYKINHFFDTVWTQFNWFRRDNKNTDPNSSWIFDWNLRRLKNRSKFRSRSIAWPKLNMLGQGNPIQGKGYYTPCAVVNENYQIMATLATYLRNFQESENLVQILRNFTWILLIVERWPSVCLNKFDYIYLNNNRLFAI